MIHFDLPKQKSSIIKVLGVGGGGSNAVNYMFAENIEGVDFIICNTDAKALEQSTVHNKIQLGPHLTQGLGAGANPEVGKQATEESLEEIKRILEVNTKMAFICAGMGGGTGTGGAPIIAKICRDLGILTVGIVTTPFGFEGPRRRQQAELGIKQLEPYVDTLLVISNDKLRMQYGNLKMKEAFGKADDVLATAAKCITDIINSRGHIIVDFADVCTVMKNGGVAILGSAAVEGEDRAQQAIEEALNSPLLNDNDIRGAKWILININSAEGEFECTMDELEIINDYMRQQAGEHTDVIVGMGYDNSLDKKIGITLIATGFEHKDPFAKREQVAEKKAEPKPEKIMMTLGVEGDEKKMYQAPQQQTLSFEDKDPFAPKLMETTGEKVIVPAKLYEEPLSVPQQNDEPQTIRLELSPEITEVKKEEPAPVAENPLVQMQYTEKPTDNGSAVNSYLNRPSNIYASVPQPPAEQPKEEVKPEPRFTQPAPVAKQEPAEDEVQFGFVIKEDNAVNSAPVGSIVNEMDEEEDQKRRAAERIQKLRNLSFNMGSSDMNTEFDNVPAYVRRNMELFGNTLTSVENYYSKYAVKKDENDKTQISTINTFLDGKKPD
ncbi:cell division protein FtsZ [Foetidibacter luteolus]|uniref:cell division protein FtsZ n=1 Tax=Foetidibacter luteolus TaxID=2608880 RepID=UPI00129B39A0|nr:cell division protein FtsZ [Foetidibacter luteolus]